MPAEEGLAWLLSVGVDAEGVVPALEQVQSTVTRFAESSQAELQRLAGVDPFVGTTAGAAAAEANVVGLTAAADQASARLRILAEQQVAISAGAGGGLILPRGLAGGEDLTRQAANLAQYQRQMRESMREFQRPFGTATEGVIAPGIEASLARVGTEAGVASAQVARLEANLERLRALPPTARGTSASGGVLPFTGGTAPGTAFLSDAEIAEQARQYKLLAAQNLVEKEGRARAPIAEDLTPLTQIPIDIKRDYEAIAQAHAEGALEFQSKGIIAVREAWMGVNGSIQPGYYNARTGAPLSRMDQLYYDSRAGAAAAGGAGGGGFLGGFGYGFTHGFGGGGNNGMLANAGQQLGLVAQYTLYFQAFRYIEESIKASVEETVKFERAVTDLSNRLDISKESARGLATQMGLVGAQAGLNPVEAIQLGAGFAGVFAGQAPTDVLAQQGAQYGAQLQVLTGDAKTALPEATAVVRSFNLTFGDTGRVIDAATSAAQNFGLANASAVLPGLSTIGDLAKEAGFSVEFTANALADIQSRTSDTSAAVAGQLQRFLGREGNSAFQAVFANMGINTNQGFSQELAQLSGQFDKLSESQRAFIIGQFGGGRAGVAALAFIEDYDRIVKATSKSLAEGGIAQQQYYQRLNDFQGILHTIRSEFEELAKDLGESGALSGFGVMLIGAKDLLAVVDELVRGVGFLASFGGQGWGKDIRDTAVTLLEVYGLVRGISAIRGGAAAGRGGGVLGGSGGPVATASNRTAAALDRLAASATRAAEANTEDAASTEIDSAAKIRDAEVTGARGLFGVLQRRFPGALAGESGAYSGVGMGFGPYGLPTFAGITGAGLAGAATSLPGIIGGAILTQQIYSAAKRVFPAIQAAQSGSQYAFAYGIDPEDMQSEAQRLRRQASAATGASGGFFGTIENGLGAAEGRLGGFANSDWNLPALVTRNTLGRIPVLGHVANFLSNPVGSLFGHENTETSGDVASRNRALASLLTIEADRAKQASQDAYNRGDYSGQIDLTKQGGVTDSLKNLATLGLDATQQFDALNERLRNFGEAAAGTANYLARGSAVLVAQQVANRATTNLLNLVNDPHNAGEGILHSKDFASKLAPGLNAAIDQTAQDFLGPLQGKSVGPAQQQQLEHQLQATMVNYLKKSGWTPEHIKDVLPDLHAAAGSAVQLQVAQMNAAHGVPISQDAIGGVIQALPNLISQTTTIVSNQAALGKIAAPQGTQVAGLDAALKDAQETYHSLLLSGAKKWQLKQAKDIIDGLRVQVQSAVLANLQQQQQLVEASIPSENTLQAVNQQVSDLKARLAVTKNPDDRLPIRIALAQARQQRKDAREADAASTIGLDTDPRDTVQQAKDTLAQQQMLVDSYKTRGITGKALNDAEKQLASDRQAVTQAELGNAIAQRDASVRAGDPLAAASQTLQDAKSALAADLVGSTQYWQDYKAVQQAKAEMANQDAANARQVFLLAHDTTDPVAQAEATLRQAQVQLRRDRANGTGNLGADKLGVETGRQGVQRARFDQRMQDEQTAYDLQEIGTASYLRFLEHQDSVLRRQLDGMKKNSEGYRQRLDELHQVDQAMKGLNQQASGMWNLGDIKIPTPYEAKRYLAATNAGLNYNVAPVTNNRYAIHINGADTAKVEAIMHRLLGPVAFGSRSHKSRKG